MQNLTAIWLVIALFFSIFTYYFWRFSAEAKRHAANVEGQRHPFANEIPTAGKLPDAAVDAFKLVFETESFGYKVAAAAAFLSVVAAVIAAWPSL